MGEPRRPDRVAEAIREQVSTLLADGAKDPRNKASITIAAADLTPSTRHPISSCSLIGD